MTIQVCVVEDHPMMTEAICSTLKTDPNLEVCGTAESMEDLFQLLQTVQPDVLILDIQLPNSSGIEIIKLLKKNKHVLPVLVFSSSIAPDLITSALQNGALGYLSKYAESGVFLKAVHTVANGKAFLTPEVSDILIKSMHENIESKTVQVLTQREKQILNCLADGIDNTQIANKLNISPKTVRTHISNVMKKLDIDTRGRLIIFGTKQKKDN